MKRLWEKINCASHLFEKILITLKYMRMESHRKWKKENREKNFIITGLKFSRHDESFKLINREVQLIQGQEMRQLFKGAWQFIVKNNQPKKCNQKEKQAQ